MSAQQPASLLQVLTQFAANLHGDYRGRFDRILAQAFREHVVVLNAKQLRDIAGGGSQSTAQAAIDSFRGELHRKLSFRLDLGEGVPAEITASASDAVTRLWAQANVAARQQFDDDLAGKNGELEAARRALDIQVKRSSALELAIATSLERAETAQVACVAVEQALGTSQSELARLTAAAADLERQVERQRGNLAEAQAAAAARFEQMLRAHQDQLRALARERETESRRLIDERNAATRDRDVAKDQRVEADLGRARAEQRAARAEAETINQAEAAAAAAVEAKDANLRLQHALQRQAGAEARAQTLETQLQRASLANRSRVRAKTSSSG